STFGKPATTGFGQTSAFGQPSSSLFGGNQTNLFGTANSSPFGAPQATTQSGFGGFSQPANTSVFGSATGNQNTSIFGQSGTSAFGAAKPSGFGFGGTQPQTSIFGQASTSNATGTSFFGQQTTGNSSIFGATATPAFGAAAPGAGGTALAKYQPSIGTDTLMKNGQQSSVSTKQHCITAMKEYEEKSLEELRMEDYVASRKGPQAGAVGGIFGNQAPTSNLFGAPAQQQKTGLFGQQPENKGLFGNTNTMAGFGQASAFGATTSQPSAGGLFNKPFAAPTTSTSNFGFGNTANNASTNMFGAKPFGAPATGKASFRGETSDGEDMLLTTSEPHPTGIVLRRSGYYTIPSLDELQNYLKEDGTCIVPNFTVGRERYGNVFFDEEMDVAGVNLDETVFFRHKEVVIYALDEQKPPIGMGLNRPAQVTLDQLWPMDKTTHEPIKDPERLESIEYEERLRRACKKYDTRFIDYRPETGSWVFKVDHFSKYGLTESDEEDAGPVDPAKKAKITAPAVQQKGQVAAGAKQTPVATSEAPVASSSNLYPDIDELRQMTTMPKSMVEMEDDFDMDFMPNFSHAHPVSPSASMAMEMGAKSHKLQLMKAAFFTEDDYDNRSICTDSVTGRESPDQDQIVPSRRLGSRFSSMQSIYKESSVMSLQTQSDDTPIVSRIVGLPAKVEVPEKKLPRQIIEPIYYPLVVEPKIAIVNPVGTIVPFANSVAKHLKAKCIADIGILAGRRFRVGWGPRNSCVILTTAQVVQDIKRATTSLGDFAPVLAARASDDKSPAIAMRLEVASVLPIRGFQRSIQKHLSIQLKYCEKIIFSPSECPQFLPAGGTDLLQEHCQQAREQQGQSQHEKYAQSVWALCEALWGEEEELQGQDPASHLTVMRRRELLSNWLEEVVSEKPISVAESSDYLEYLIELLYAHKVTEACELAFMKNDMNLSLLISQSSGGPIVRQLIQHQLASWQEVEADKFINVNRLKVFMLVAGIPLLSSANGTLDGGKGGTINVFKDVDWITALASAFMSEDGVAAPPNPPYTDYEVDSKHPIQDLRYHLLKLYSKRSHRIETLLNPATHTADSMDFRLSWLLLQTLDTLGYHHCSEKSECQLHTSFASQLENYGMWHWAIFVLLHIRNRERREISVQQILFRYIRLSEEEEGFADEEYEAKERFVIENLHVPVTWICWAKAVRAGSMKRYQEQAEFLIRAKQWNLAHEIIMNHIAPDAVINDNIPYLKELLKSLKETKKILNWRNQGQILYDFIDMNEKFESLKMVAESDLVSHWEGLKPQLDELCSRINLFPCPTAKHRLCQSEISQRLACLVRGILMTSPHLNPCLLIKVALEKLPLPQEYAQKELKFFIDSVMVENFQHTDEQMDA
uniref:Nuclear pore complex protein Nup98-Nup96 n=1 Tax=Phlebotomus papatasi TaxID=29031 RepID=A0A1B0D922_PHLPP